MISVVFSCTVPQSVTLNDSTRITCTISDEFTDEVQG